MIAANDAVKLVVEDVADGRLERQPFFLAAGRVGPQDLFRHLKPGRSSLGKDLKPRLWQEAAGIAPCSAMISAKRDLSGCAAGECRGETLEVRLGSDRSGAVMTWHCIPCSESGSVWKTKQHQSRR